MTKVTCGPPHLLPVLLDQDTHYISLFGRDNREAVGYAGLDMERCIRAAKLAPSVAAWDLSCKSLTRP